MLLLCIGLAKLMGVSMRYLVLLPLIFTACSNFKGVVSSISPSKDKSSLQIEAERLDLPLNSFLSADRVLIGNDMVVNPSQLTRENGVLKIADSRGGVRTNSNLQGGYWINGVPIKFAPNTPPRLREATINACREFGIHCACQTSEASYVYVDMKASTDCNSSNVPEYLACADYPREGQTRISLNPLTYSSVVVHELGHTLGLVHEHQRPDRLEYILPEGIHEEEFGQAFGPFDYESVMLYDCQYNNVLLIDQSKCGLSGFFAGKASAGDRAAVANIAGTTDLRGCADQQKWRVRFQSTTGQRIMNAELQISLTPQGEALFDSRTPTGEFYITTRFATLYIRHRADGYQDDSYFIRIPEDVLPNGDIPLRPMIPVVAESTPTPPASSTPPSTTQPPVATQPPASQVTAANLSICFISASKQSVADIRVQVGEFRQTTTSNGCVSGPVPFGSYVGVAEKDGVGRIERPIEHFGGANSFSVQVP